MLKEGPGDSPEALVKSRAEARWKAMIAKDYRTAYSYLSPGFRIKVDEYAYRNRFAGKTDFHSARVKGVSCDGGKCQVEVETQYTIHAIPPFNVEFQRKGEERENWVLLDGEWWLVPRR